MLAPSVSACISSAVILIEGLLPSGREELALSLIALDQEHPTYIKVEAYSTSAFAKILIKKAFSIGEMQVGDAKDVNLTRDSNIAFYKFTAPEDGVYIFDSNSKNTVYIYASDNIGFLIQCKSLNLSTRR